MIPQYYWLQLGFDACHEMFVFWQTAINEPSTIQWRQRGTQQPWALATGSGTPHPYFENRVVHRVDLSGLDADTEYEWRWHEGGDPRYFRTFPSELSREIVIGESSDCYRWHGAPVNMPPWEEGLWKMTQWMAGFGLDAVLLPGDICHDNAHEDRRHYWDELWDAFTPGFTMPDGRVVPLIPGVGNHDIYNHPSIGSLADAVILNIQFALPPGTSGWYYEVVAGEWFSLCMIDSWHATGSASASHPQLSWIENVLEGNQNVTHRIAALHVPPWSAARPDSEGRHRRSRDYLHPLLVFGGIRTAFTGHEHLMSRTIRLGLSSPDPDNGIVYIGDGGMGIEVRSASRKNDWYVHEAYDDEIRGRHFHVLRLSPQELRVETVDFSGAVHLTLIDPVHARPTEGVTLRPEPESLVLYPEGYLNGTPQPDDAPTMAPAVTLTPLSQTALSLSLSEVDGATGYRYRVGTSGSWTDLGSGRTAQITGLTPGTSYTVQARAYNEAGDGPIGSATASTLAPEVNAPPVFQTSPPTTVRAGQAYVYNGVVTDADGDPITITLEEGPDWLELTDHGDGTFTLEGTAPNE